MDAVKGQRYKAMELKHLCRVESSTRKADQAEIRLVRRVVVRRVSPAASSRASIWFQTYFGGIFIDWRLFLHAKMPKVFSEAK